jgi:hypothetical protein
MVLTVSALVIDAQALRILADAKRAQRVDGMPNAECCNQIKTLLGEARRVGIFAEQVRDE